MKLAVVVVVALAACQIRPSDEEVFYGFDVNGLPVALDGGMTGSDAPHEGSGSGDGGGSGSGDGGTGDAGVGDDAGGTGGPGGGPGLGNHAAIDDTSFYACSAGGWTGALIPVIAIVAIGVRRRRRYGANTTKQSST